MLPCPVELGMFRAGGSCFAEASAKFILAVPTNYESKSDMRKVYLF